MPLYAFEVVDEPGAVAEEWFSMSEAPRIGDEIRLAGDGRRARRIPSSEGAVQLCVPQWECTGTRQIHRDQLPESFRRVHKHYDGAGNPVLRNRHDQELLVKHCVDAGLIHHSSCTD